MTNRSSGRSHEPHQGGRHRLRALLRAAHFDQEATRLFQQFGIAAAVLAHARPVPDYDFRAADGQVLMRFDAARGAPAVLVRPDRHVFGFGEPDALLTAWRAPLRTAISA